MHRETPATNSVLQTPGFRLQSIRKKEIPSRIDRWSERQQTKATKELLPSRTDRSIHPDNNNNTPIYSWLLGWISFGFCAGSRSMNE
mmetsp:Transcript_18170/g.41546  ORF Transcript_18170/g.41546 Transcript_18170/m.41546 type:complete len:87 (+) Transcript_18170:222-482(+)